MKTSSSDRELYLAYRLDELSPEERRGVEDRMLADEEYSDRMQEAEYDLLDDYRANRLNIATRVRVEHAFSHDELRQPSPFALRSRRPRAVTAHRFAFRFSLAFRIASAAAAIVLIAIAVWMIAARLHSGSVNSLPGARTAPLLPPSGTQSNQTAASQPQLSNDTAVLLLAPGVTRGSGAAQLELRPGIRNVVVQWVVPQDLEPRGFSLLIQQSGKEVAVVPASNIQKIDGNNIAEFSLPRATFSAAALHARYLFIVRKPSPVSRTEAEFPVLVTSDSNQ